VCKSVKAPGPTCVSSGALSGDARRSALAASLLLVLLILATIVLACSMNPAISPVVHKHRVSQPMTRMHTSPYLTVDELPQVETRGWG